MVFEVIEAAQVNLESLEQSCLKPLQNFEEKQLLNSTYRCQVCKKAPSDTNTCKWSHLADGMQISTLN